MAQKITQNADGSLNVPSDPIIPFIEGDGTGVDIWPAAKLVLDAAAKKLSESQVLWINHQGSHVDSSKKEWGDYVPAKVAFVVPGALVTGLTYAMTLGNEDATSATWHTAAGGDYLITPTMVRDGESPRFVGSARPRVDVPTDPSGGSRREHRPAH